MTENRFAPLSPTDPLVKNVSPLSQSTDLKNQKSGEPPVDVDDDEFSIDGFDNQTIYYVIFYQKWKFPHFNCIYNRI